MKVVGLGAKYRLSKPWEQSELDFVFEQTLNLKPEEMDSLTARACIEQFEEIQKRSHHRKVVGAFFHGLR